MLIFEERTRPNENKKCCKFAFRELESLSNIVMGNNYMQLVGSLWEKISILRPYLNYPGNGIRPLYTPALPRFRRPWDLLFPIYNTLFTS